MEDKMTSTLITVDEKIFLRLQKLIGKKELVEIINYLIHEFLNEQDEIKEALSRDDEADLTGDELRSKLNL
jgi:hypothetical protein